MVRGGESEGSWRDRAASHIDECLAPALLPATVLDQVFAHSRECYPEECCGILTGPTGGRPIEVVRCTNLQNVRYSRGESELDARHGFFMDERELYRACRGAEERGYAVLVIYHSHVDTEAYFSKQDVDGALGPDGEPLWPGARQLVVSVHEGEVQRAGLFEWESSDGTYVGRLVRAEPS